MNARAIHVDPKIILEMSLREAEILRALVGGVDLKSVSEATRCMKDLFEAFTAAGVSPERESFSDFFAGRVETKATPHAAKKATAAP